MIGRSTWLNRRNSALLMVSTLAATNFAPFAACAQSLPIGLGLGLGMGLLRSARRRQSSSYSDPSGGSINNGGSSYSGSSRSSSAARRTKNAAISTYNKSVKLFNGEKYEEAAALLSQAVEIDPKMGSAYALLGVCQARGGQYAEAMNNFVVAQNYGNRYQSLLFEEGLCAAHMQDYRLARECFQQFLEKGNLPQTETAQKALAIITHNFVAQADGDYLKEASKEGIRRWPDVSVPLKVYIEENPSLPGYRPEFGQLVKQSFDDWARGTGEKVSFVFTADPSQAQIRCSWTDNQADLGDTKELGITHVIFSSEGIIETAHIKLWTLKGFCRDDVAELLPLA